MTLQATLTEEEHGAMDEGLRPHYRKQDDGSFILDVGSAGGLELQDVSGLKSGISKERKLRADAERASKDMSEKYGDLDPEAARDALKRIEELGGMSGEEAVTKKVEAAVALKQAKFDRDLQAEKTAAKKVADDHSTELKVATVQLAREMVDSRAVKALLSFKGSPELLLPIIQQRARVEKQADGSFAIRLYDAGGNEMYCPKKGNTNPMTIEEFVGVLQADSKYAGAFDGTSASGAGGNRGGKGGAPAGAKRVSRNDPAAISANIEDIASGKVVVVDDDDE